MKRIRGYKYRAYPTVKQQGFFEKTFGCCRFVYNYYLEIKQHMWNESHRTLSYAEMSKDLSSRLKKENEQEKTSEIIHLGGDDPSEKFQSNTVTPFEVNGRVS